MTTYAELEIGLRSQGRDRYSIELRFQAPDSGAEVRPAQGSFQITAAELEALSTRPADIQAHGQALYTRLVHAAGVHAALGQALSAAQAIDRPLRVRLFVGAGAPGLHDLAWETLHRPQDPAHLFLNEGVVFSRFLSSDDWRPVRMRRLSDLSALVVIANPGDLHQYEVNQEPLPPIDAAKELERAREALGDLPITALATPGTATLEGIVTHLRAGHDVLYLVCHGAHREGATTLWLEDEGGLSDLVDGEALTTRLLQLRQRPQLVVLAACQTAGSGESRRSDDRGALAALGPRLAQRGIPAVLAMQDNVTSKTVAAFMPTFFRELRRDGQIDRAATAARAAVQTHDDWWVPALFMRLKSGRLWYTPGFTDRENRQPVWPAIITGLANQNCTPILGPAMNEHIFGAWRDLAYDLAEEDHFPLGPHQREELPPVAQYLAVNHGIDNLHERVMRHLVQKIQARYGALLSDAQRAPFGPLTGLAAIARRLGELLQVVWQQRQADDPAEPYRRLAHLPIALYVSADPTHLLRHALERAGKTPRVELCRWNAYTLEQPELDRTYEPDEENPLIYQLYGTLAEPESLVLTEDDYLDYLIRSTQNQDLVPDVVKGALASKALIFLGFRQNAWSFRVLFRSLMSQEVRLWKTDERKKNVAAQVEPEEGRAVAPERACRYLESYFGAANINVYWGNVVDFCRELHQQVSGGTP